MHTRCIIGIKEWIYLDRELKRVNMNLPAELILKVDTYAARLCITRSAAITVLLSTALEQAGAMSTLQEMIELYKNATPDA